MGWSHMVFTLLSIAIIAASALEFSDPNLNANDFNLRSHTYSFDIG
jgi:hypothetical protein